MQEIWECCMAADKGQSQNKLSDPKKNICLLI